MKHILIVGASGKVGKILAEKLKNAPDFIPTAFFRSPGQKVFFEEMGVAYHVGSIENSPEEIADALKGMDAVVFSAGSGGHTGDDKTLTVDLDGAVKVMEAAEKAKVKRFIMVSALNADYRRTWEHSGLKPYYIAKHYADFVLKHTALDYTIIRPGRLLDSNGKGKINITTPDEEAGVPREDVAEVIVNVLRNDNTIGKVIAFNQGQQPIEAALRQYENQ